jgi:anti-sigma factor RsiW
MSVPECERLDDYLLDGLPDDEAAGFEAHLADCPACREELHQQRRIDRLLAAATGQLGPVPASLIDRIEEEFYRSHRRRVVRFAWGLSAAAVAASALAVLLVMGAFGTGNQPQPIMQEHPAPAGDAEQTASRSRQVPRPGAVARVTVDDPSAAILVPLQSGKPNITIVWVYPTVKVVQAPMMPGNDRLPSTP